MATDTKAKKRPSTLEKGRKRILTGVQATGDMHLGNFYGAIRPSVELSRDPQNQVILLCADWHGLTNKAKIKEPGQKAPAIVAAYLALGFELKGNAIIRQSQFPQIMENAWYLSCVSAVGLLERAHAFKDAVANGKEATAGLFYYPVLMASDIMTFDAECVPVGKDQAQHLEYCSDMGKLFNNAVQSEVFHEPLAMIQETPLLVGIDGQRKMSKSYGNDIPLFATSKEVEKKIKEIKTDSKGLDDPKDPNTCAVFQILQSFAPSDAVEYMKDRLEKGVGYGYGHAKKDLHEEYVRFFEEKRLAFEHYLSSPKEVENKLGNCFEDMTLLANTVRDRARASLGL
jgi:tryptophanyl-tRNA synthetase